MKRLMILASLVVSGFVFTAFAQPCPQGCDGRCGPGEMGMGMGPGPMRKEMMREHRMERMHEGRMMHMGMMMEEGERTTVRGRVVSIDPRPMGARMMVEEDSRLVPVMLGPGWGRPDDDERKVEVNDMVEVHGKRVMKDGQPFVIAGEITLNDDDKVITLRPERKEMMERRMMHKRHVAY